jgi:allantoin racemase
MAGSRVPAVTGRWEVPRILVINPNSSLACGAGIEAAIAPLRGTSGMGIDVVSLPSGPPAIYSWRDWHAAVEPICCCIEQECADAYVIACASDPGIEAARASTSVPVIGIFRASVATAIARGERFGVVALVEASKSRHLAALRAMGLETRLAMEITLNVSMDTLLDGDAARSVLIEAARSCTKAGADTVILGCTGMAHHKDAIAAAGGIPVIEPCRAGVVLAVSAVL